MRRLSMIGGGALAGMLALGACGSSKAPATGGGGSTGSGGAGGVAGGGTDGGVALKPFTKPVDPGNGGIVFAASGEVLALSGYAFPPANAGDPAFVDGWDVQFTRLLVTVDKIKLSSNPDYSPDQGTLSASSLVAEVDGPWAVDLAHVATPTTCRGKGGPGEAASSRSRPLSRQNQPAVVQHGGLQDGRKRATRSASTRWRRRRRR